MNIITKPTSETQAFEIRTINWLQANRKQQLETTHACWQFMIVWIQKGTLVHCIDSKKYEIADRLYCIMPGHMHRLTVKGDAEGYIIYFNGDHAGVNGASDLLFSTNIFHSNPVDILETFPEENVKEVEDIFFRIMKEFDQHSLRRFKILFSFFKLLLTYLDYFSGTAKNYHGVMPKRMDIVKRYFTLLEKDYAHKKQVTDYASAMAITPSYLNEIIKGATGNPASYHIRQRIISEAKQQAIYNGSSMKETAYKLGFDDISHFSKYFKNATGKNFSEFKKHYCQHILSMV